MDCLVLNDARRYAAAIFLVAGVTGCSSATVDCGGQVHPENLGADALRIVEKAKADSKAFCSESDSGCDFTVAKTAQGWSVAATRIFAVDGKCASRIGDERFFSYDESGTLLRVIEGA